MFYTLFCPIFWSPKNWITNTGEHYLITKYNDPFSKIYQTVTHFSQTQILKTCFLWTRPVSMSQTNFIIVQLTSFNGDFLFLGVFDSEVDTIFFVCNRLDLLWVETSSFAEFSSEFFPLYILESFCVILKTVFCRFSDFQ